MPLCAPSIQSVQSREGDIYYGLFEMIRRWNTTYWLPEITVSRQPSLGPARVRDVRYHGR